MRAIKQLSIVVIFAALCAQTGVTVLASESGDQNMADFETNGVASAEMLGASEQEINTATTEEYETVSRAGTLIEIGNTTALNTTVIVRVSDRSGATEDITLEIDEKTTVISDADLKAGLSDWIAGDHIMFTARQYEHSGAWVAIRVKNSSFKVFHRGINGWITAIRETEKKVDVSWEGSVYTLNVSDAKMVAGLKNPASISDLKVGDRVRARVENDGDGSRLTWNAKILVVLRRGENLFMRITRWVVPAKISMIPDATAFPLTMLVTVLPSKFFQEGDVNNLIGAPGAELLVDATDRTKLVRRYRGRALWSEFSEGDMIRIIGRRDEATGHLVAHYIKNESIQKLGVAHHLSRITAIDTQSKTLTVALVRGKSAAAQWTVKTTEQTRYYKNRQSVAFSDFAVGDIIRVRGTANSIQKSVTAQSISAVNASRASE